MRRSVCEEMLEASSNPHPRPRPHPHPHPSPCPRPYPHSCPRACPRPSITPTLSLTRAGARSVRPGRSLRQVTQPRTSWSRGAGSAGASDTASQPLYTVTDGLKIQIVYEISPFVAERGVTCVKRLPQCPTERLTERRARATERREDSRHTRASDR